MKISQVVWDRTAYTIYQIEDNGTRNMLLIGSAFVSVVIFALYTHYTQQGPLFYKMADLKY